ncbi:hypothetical protein FKM82_015913 [Ascaphus truei]
MSVDGARPTLFAICPPCGNSKANLCANGKPCEGRNCVWSYGSCMSPDNKGGHSLYGEAATWTICGQKSLKILMGIFRYKWPKWDV